jgi:hypothetical protein
MKIKEQSRILSFPFKARKEVAEEYRNHIHKQAKESMQYLYRNGE